MSRPEEKFTAELYTSLRNVVRSQVAKVWRAHNAGERLHGEERILADCLAARPEWEDWWGWADDLGDQEVRTPEGVNPFAVVAVEAANRILALGWEWRVPRSYRQFRRDGRTGKEARDAIARILLDTIKPPLLNPWTTDPPPTRELHRYGLRRDPDDPRAFWEWECFQQHVYSYYLQGTPGNPEGYGRIFWERMQSCDRLEDLCQKHPARLVHRVIFLLRSIHDSRLSRRPSPTGELRRLKREAEREYRAIQRLKRDLSSRGLPIPPSLDDDERLAAKRAKDPRPEVMVIRFSDPAKNVELPLERTPPERHRPVGTEKFPNADLFLLSKAVLALVGKYRQWIVMANLVRHFCPELYDLELTPQAVAERLRNLVEKFKTKHRDQFEDLPPGCKAKPRPYLKALWQDLKGRVFSLLHPEVVEQRLKRQLARLQKRHPKPTRSGK